MAPPRPPLDVGRTIDEGNWTVYQRWLVFLAALTIIFDGIDNQLLGITIPAIMADWHVARSAFAPIVALGFVGMMAGGALAGIAGDRFGRRIALLGSMGLFGAATLAVSVVSAVYPLALLRFVAGIGLGGRQSIKLPTADPGHQEALLLILGPEPPDRGQCDPAVGADTRGEPARPAPGHLLGEHRVGDRIVAAAIALRELQADVAELGEAPEHLVGKPPGVLPLRRARGELGLNEAPDHRAELNVLRCKGRDRTARMRAVPRPRMRGRAGRCMHRPGTHSPYERPITSSMISSVPAPIRFRRRSRQDRSIPYSFM